MLFSNLDPDNKTYSYLKEYLDFLSRSGNYANKKSGNILSVDNEIQSREIRDHLTRHNIDPDRDTPEKNNEVEKWIKENAKPFRMYLSSIKILASYSYTKGFIYSATLNFDDFQALCRDFNYLKDILIDHIF